MKLHQALLSSLLFACLSISYPTFAAEPTPQQCGPSPGGAPCSGSGPASLSTESGANPGAGNPINVINGNKYQQEIDLPALPGVLGLEIVRHYNSAYSGSNAPNGILGRGWRLSYETELNAIGPSIQIIQADGTRILFARDAKTPNLCASNDATQGRILIQKTSRGDEYTWVWQNGRRLSFNVSGKLIQIQAPTGEFLSLQRDTQGTLVKVIDPQGRELRLSYLDPKLAKNNERFKGVQTIDSPVGRFSYEYGSPAPKGMTEPTKQLLANLSKVSLPTHYDSSTQAHAYTERGVSSSSINRIYHYEDARHPTRLTGITVSGMGSDNKLMNQRISTWAYDETGRGILSVKGLPRQTGKDGKPIPGTGIEQVNLDYSQNGKTILTNSLNQTTTYTHANIGDQNRLLEVSGAGCATCNETNIKYAYDKLGRMLEQTKLSPSGQSIQTIRTERDAMGRVIKVSRINYKNNKAQAAQMMVRYEYQGEATQPTIIARPSVITGREQQTRIDYNNAGQALKVSETGFSPGLDKTAPTSIERSTTYTYSSINGRSLLTQIDGPLPNGKSNSPVDSDITLIKYEGRGSYTTEVIAPGNVITKIAERDQAGRPITVSLNDGARLIQSTIAVDSKSHAQQITHSAWLLDAKGRPDISSLSTRVSKFEYDARGDLSATTQPDGVSNRIERDAGGRMSRLLDPQKNQIAYSLDSESRLVAWLAQTARGDILNGQMYLRDQSNQLLATLSPQPLTPPAAAVKIAAASPNPSNDPPPLGVVERAADGLHTLAADGAAHHVFQGRAGAGYLDPAGRLSGVLIDDFKRVVYETHPDEGRISYVYGKGYTEKRHSATDASRTLIERLTFNSAGQLISRTRAGCTETLSYNGQLLKQLTGCGNLSAYTRDAFGLITGETQTIAKVDSPGNIVLRTTHRYDAAGRLIARGLADGQMLHYRYDANGNQAAVLREAGWLDQLRRAISSSLANWIAANLSDKLALAPIIDQLAWQPFNGPMISAQTNNGIKTNWRYDRTGQLSEIESSSANNNTPVHKLNYQRDYRGRILASDEQTNQAKASHTEYDYDGVGRLVQVTGGQAEPSAIQRISSVSPTQTVAYTPLGQRQTAQPEYDNFGRQSQRISSGKQVAQHLLWNDVHQLIEIKQDGQTLAKYRYDAHGNRIAKTISQNGKAHTTYYQHDSQHRLIAELDQAGNITTQYLYSGYTPYAVLKANGAKATREVYAIHADQRGLPLQVTDQHAQVVWQQRFDAWGKRTAANDANFKMPLRLAGQVEDEESGLYYNINRYYDAAQGRYLSPDPLGWMHGDDTYAYANNDPINGVDPLGLFKVPSGAFLGSDSIYVDRKVGDSDGGHGDILRVAFAQYQRENGFRFSQEIIDQIIINNYHSDANPATGCFSISPGIAGGGQCNAKNHFDNLNDGAVYQLIDNGDGTQSIGAKFSSYTNGQDDSWIGDSIKQLNTNRAKYANVQDLTVIGLGIRISDIFNAFGQNSHAIADFYAHSNWVDSDKYTDKLIDGKTVREYERGGFFKEQISGGVLNAQYKCGWVPLGLNQTRVWDEDFDVVPLDNIFTGTVAVTGAEGKSPYLCKNLIKGDITCTADKSTHGYWEKDEDGLTPGEKELGKKGDGISFTGAEQTAFATNGQYFWQVKKYTGKPPTKLDPITKKIIPGVFGVDWYGDTGKAQSDIFTGDRIYVRQPITNRHRLAYNLAVEATKKEIARLFSAADKVKVGSLGLQDVFKLDAYTLDANGIEYKQLLPKI